MKGLKFLIPSLILLLLSGCAPENPENIAGTTENNQYVNSWMYGILKKYYYWNDKLPVSPNLKIDPQSFFSTLKYTYNPVTAPDGDRFSWIQEDYTELQNSLNGVVSNEIGFDMSLYYMDETHINIIAQINYVKKGTPAEAMGIKRGMIFNKVDGVTMTVSNYGTLLNFSGVIHSLNIVEPIFNEQNDRIGYDDVQVINVQTLSVYAESPVYMDSIYTIGSKKIGYVVYNFFASGPVAGSYQYDLDLNAIFGKFKTQGITDLIFDLRYNSGGGIQSAITLASNIVPDLSTNKLLSYFEYNPELQGLYISQWGSDALSTNFESTIRNDNNNILQTVNNVGNQLNGKFYVLTGQNTASASELLINGLKPYMNVILIGDTTYGKNVASSTFYDEKHTDKNKWGLQPIIAKYFNSEGKSDFTAGFAPDFFVKDGGFGMLDFGDTNERLLKKALDEITGNNVPPINAVRSDNIKNSSLVALKSKKIRGLQIENPSFLK